MYEHWGFFSSDSIHLDELSLKAQKKIRRKQLLERYGGSCVYCDKPNAETLDHIVAKTKGGDRGPNNLLPCCGRCNNSKGDKHWRVWFRGQAFYSRDRESKIEEWVIAKEKP